MAARKHTPWYPVSTPPVRTGWYETKSFFAAGVIRRHWNGKRFSAFNDSTRPSYFMGRADSVWRGLIKPAGA